MSHYKLIYFNGRGRGEIIRLIFAAAGAPYEDVRIEMAQWAELKPTTPMGQLPLLEVDGTTLCQSIAIARHVARKFGLAGKTELDQTKVDVIVDCVEDAIKPIPAFWRFEKDETRKAQLKKTYIEEQLPAYLTNLQNFLDKNNNGNGYFIGDGLTWADLHFLTLYDRLKLQVGLTNPLENHPKLKALQERVSGLQKIAEWISKRPDTSF